MIHHFITHLIVGWHIFGMWNQRDRLGTQLLASDDVITQCTVLLMLKNRAIAMINCSLKADALGEQNRLIYIVIFSTGRLAPTWDRLFEVWPQFEKFGNRWLKSVRVQCSLLVPRATGSGESLYWFHVQQGLENLFIGSMCNKVWRISLLVPCATGSGESLYWFHVQQGLENLFIGSMCNRVWRISLLVPCATGSGESQWSTSKDEWLV